MAAALGYATGAMGYDDDDEREESKKRREKGIENGSIYTPYGRLVLPKSPPTAIFVSGATFYEQLNMSRQSGVPAIMNAATESFSDMASEMPYINASYSLYRSLKKKSLGEFTGNILSGYVPASAMVRSISEVTDEKDRSGSGFKRTEKPKSIFTPEWVNEQGRGFKNTFIKGIPFAREYAPEHYIQTPRGPWWRRTLRQVDPFNIRPANTYTAPVKDADKKPINAQEYIKTPDFKRMTTDDVATMILIEGQDWSDADKKVYRDALKQKADSAAKRKSLTDKELEYVRKVLPSYTPKR
jgi:hypothetical protein